MKLLREMPKKDQVSDVGDVEQGERLVEPKKNTFFLSRAITLQLKDLDKCCCADVPCVSIVKEYFESRWGL